MSERDDVKLLILESGEQIVGRVTEETDNGVVVEQPQAIVPVPDPNNPGQAVMAFRAYLQLSDLEEVEFPNKTVRHVLPAKDGLVQDWINRFGSGIVAPATELLLA